MQTSKHWYWLAQILGWFSYGILIFLATYAENFEKINAKFLISILLFLFFGISVTHLLRFIFLKLNYLDLKPIKLIPRVLFFTFLASLIIAFCNYGITIFIERDFSRPITPLNVIIDTFSIGVLLILWNAIYFIFHYSKKNTKQEIDVLQMQASQNEIELKSLRAQMNPHFLFNSLNSIRALIDLEPSKAKQSVTTLSNLLRKSLIHGKNSFISIDEEVEIVKYYLELEKIRFEERLSFDIQVDNAIASVYIPPFLIHTQVENAIKHGISKLIEGGIVKISIKAISENEILIQIINTGTIQQSVSDTSIGIENTKRRLFLIYKDKAKFELIEENNLVYCNIIINNSMS